MFGADPDHLIPPVFLHSKESDFRTHIEFSDPHFPYQGGMNRICYGY